MTARNAEDAKARRAAARSAWRIRRFPLGGEPEPDLSETIDAAQRIGMVWQLTLDAWAMSSRPLPDYPRDKSPGRIPVPAKMTDAPMLKSQRNQSAIRDRQR